MRVFYLDPGLASEMGHHVSYFRSIVGELRRRGVEVLAYGPMTVPPAMQDELGVAPHFRAFGYAPANPDFGGWLKDFAAMAQLTVEDLAALPPSAPDDLVYLSSAMPAQLRAIGQFLADRAPDRRPRAVVEIFGAGMPSRPAPGAPPVLPSPLEDSRPALYRQAARPLPALAARDLRVVTFDAATSDIVGFLIGRPVETLPLPFETLTALRSRAGARPVRMAILGHQRLNKGYRELPAMVAAALQVEGDVRLLLQLAAVAAPPEIAAAIHDLARHDDRLTLYQRAAGRAAWARLLNETDLVVCPYSRDNYAASHSAVATEAAANGIPMVVPADTTLATLLAACEYSGTVFTRFEPDALRAATQQALDDFDRYAARAFAAGEAWSRRYGPARMVDALLALIA